MKKKTKKGKGLKGFYAFQLHFFKEPPPKPVIPSFIVRWDNWDEQVNVELNTKSPFAEEFDDEVVESYTEWLPGRIAKDVLIADPFPNLKVMIVAMINKYVHEEDYLSNSYKTFLTRMYLSAINDRTEDFKYEL